MPETLLHLSRIGKRFGNNRVLDDVSFDLMAGEVHVLAGENGAGKSTLIKILAGVHQDFDGTIELGGRATRFKGPSDAAAQGVSVIHQELSLVDAMSVVDNVCLGREITRGGGLFLDQESELERVLHVCALIDLRLSREDLKRPVSAFPLSVKNQIEIAKALLGDARILIMDEPSSALNQVEAERLFTLVDALRERDCGILYITHKMEEIYRLADRITILRDGRLVSTLPAAECPQEALVRGMIGRPVASLIPGRAGDLPQPLAQPRLSVRGFSIPAAERGRPDVVQDFSLDLRSGEIVGLAGLQGSGGADVLRALFGADGALCTGSIALDGVPFVPKNPRDAIGRGLAFLTGDRKGSGLVLAMSVEANLSLAALPAVSPAGILSAGLERQLAERSVRSLGIRLASVAQEAGTLSGGNQQKVVLAKWLETHPRVLLLEEPTRGVDIGAKHEIYTLLRQRAAEGLAILVVSTDMPELLGLCDRIVVLHRGRVTADFAQAEATAAGILAASMGAASEDRN